MKIEHIACLALASLTTLFAAAAPAQIEAGGLAAMQGSVNLESDGETREARIGSPVLVGDQVRTGAESRARVVLRDGSVLDVGPNSVISVDRQELDVAGARYETVVGVRGGLLRAWVGKPYAAAGARFEVETPTAVAGARGAQFVVAHDAAAEQSEITNLSGTLEVTPKLGVIAGGVQVEPGSFTRVQKGRFPEAAAPATRTQLAAQAAALDILGTGRRDGLNVLHPAILGRLLSTKDAPADVLPAAAGTGVPRVERPADFFAQRYSADVRTNTEPLLEFRQTPPGVPPVN